MKRGSLLKRIAGCAAAAVMCLTSVSFASAEPDYDYEFGVDVSRYQGNINWKELAGSGMSFAILRTGTTKYGIDSKFEEYYKGTRESGIKTGAYLYISALNLDEFRDAANQFLGYLDGKDWEMPVYIDLEDNAQTEMGKAKLTTCALACMNIISDAGYTTGLYSNKNWLTNFIDKEQVENAGYEIWYAQYPGYLIDPLEDDKSEICGIWQYSCHGKVSGIPEAEVDLNIGYRIYNEERNLARKGEPWLVPYLTRKTMRSGPGMQYGALCNIPQNSLLNVTARKYTDGQEWGRFSWNGFVGWVDLDGTFDYSVSDVPADPYFFYDINLDGKVNVMDEVVLRNYIFGDTDEGLSADLNGDGKVNVFDRMRIRAYIIDSEAAASES